MFQPQEVVLTQKAHLKIESDLKTEADSQGEINLKIEPESGFVPNVKDSVQDEISTTPSSCGNPQPEEYKQIRINIKSSQSQYKNKLKEPLERAKVILKDLCKFTPSRFSVVEREAVKSDALWIEEGEKIRDEYKRLENESENVSGQKLKSMKRSLLQKIVDKKYTMFAGLFKYRRYIQEIMARSNIIPNFKEYKDRISQVYFEKTEFEKEEDLFSWILLVRVGVLLLPKDETTVEILPLTKKKHIF
jgi:hypothetical protein